MIMTTQTMPAQTTSKALAGIEAIRNKLRSGNAKFAAAETAVREAADFCAFIRAELRIRRKEAGLDQAQVGEKLNLTQSAISKIENGRGDLGLETLYEYAEAVGLRPAMTFVPITHDIPSSDDGFSWSESLQISPNDVEEALAESIPDVLKRIVAKRAA
jgi:transcriptional regulator with XRE-family HTH domain